MEYSYSAAYDGTHDILVRGTVDSSDNESWVNVLRKIEDRLQQANELEKTGRVNYKVVAVSKNNGMPMHYSMTVNRK